MAIFSKQWSIFLQELSNSWDNSIYTLYAKELLNLESNNIVYDVKIKKKKAILIFMMLLNGWK